MVAQEVMQLARDAGAFVDARALGEQRAGGAQLGIQPALLIEGLGLLARDHAGHEHESGEAHVQQRLHQRLEPRSEEHTAAHQTRKSQSYALFWYKKTKDTNINIPI